MRHNQHGMTLVEILIVLTVGSMLAVVGTVTVTRTLQINRASTSKLSVTHDIRNISAWLHDDVTSASSAYGCNGNNGITATLTLTLPTTYQDLNSYTTIVYSKNGNELKRISGPKGLVIGQYVISTTVSSPDTAPINNCYYVEAPHLFQIDLMNGDDDYKEQTHMDLYLRSALASSGTFLNNGSGNGGQGNLPNGTPTPTATVGSGSGGQQGSTPTPTATVGSGDGGLQGTTPTSTPTPT
ncbi:MAG: prepilin-type N-terminal cleavage/methylation domain-containing protein, partial [Chloroflexi bacterium]|nr:prepilin-type N-terminal cleavage/methylation domain-containing protein [Chloroflexota bacterium]